ncbi:MAG TPA: DNA starvation/stationary phase protection protein Dps [Arsenicitalea sp.]|jgi:starvation-inducible DNA-binding protein|nr:DNA starvation/stationary phase protection protein Dps [Arsenicitalea sp.]
MPKSQIDLKSNTKTAMIDMLNAKLADVLDLSLLTKQAHWNIKGPNFIAVHLMLDDFRASLDTHSDTIAERVAQLGGIALGTTQAVGSGTSLKPYPTDITNITEHLNQLTDRYAKVANSARAGIDSAQEAGDADSADILTAYSRDLDKNLWFLQSHLDS